MMNVGLWTSSLGLSHKPKSVRETGISMFPGRFGWFTSPPYLNVTDQRLHYSIFQNRTNPQYEQFVLDDNQLELLMTGKE